MPKLTRYLQKIFANNSNQVGVFGTGVDKETSKNVETLQSADYENGWSSAIITNKNYPIWQEMDGVQYGLSYQLKYLFQNGIPEWISTETYYTNSYCRVGSNVYYSLQDDNINHNPALNDGWWTPLLTSSRSIGEIITSCVTLTDAGLHLLDGALIDGIGIYSAFVDYIADLYNDNPAASCFMQPGYTYNYTTTGTITNTDGVISGFSLSNYISTGSTFTATSSPWEINLKIKTGSPLTGAYDSDFYNGGYNSSNRNIIISLISTTGVFQVDLSSGGSTLGDVAILTGTYSVQTNTDYWLRVSWDGTVYKLEYSLDGETYITDATANSTTAIGTYTPYIGTYVGSSNDYSFTGTVDLHGCNIKSNGTIWWEGATEISPETNWQTAVSTYGVCGKFVYDSVNNTVRLPKITGIVEGTTDLTALGDLVEAGLPNITGTLAQNVCTTSWTPSNYASGAFSNSVRTSNKQNYDGDGSGSTVTIDLNASISSSIYGNSTTVQPQTIKVLYYIVVATSTKTDIQVDIDEIATDLNSKADTDLSNVPTSKGILTESYINGTSWYRVYSDGWCEQGGIQTCSNQGSIALLKNYINTNYSILFSSNGTGYANYSYISAYNKTVSGFNVAVVQGNNGASSVYTCWKACGYIR